MHPLSIAPSSPIEGQFYYDTVDKNMKQWNGTEWISYGSELILSWDNLIDIPTDLVQDSDYVHTDNNYTDTEKNKLSGIESGAQANVQSNWNSTSGDSLILNKPTALSQFTNDSLFITNTVDNLVNYYTSSNTYTKSEINSLISATPQFSIEVVSSLPTTNISTTTIYLVLKTDSETSDIYNEYIYINSSWELIGNTRIDLSDYYTITEIDTKLATKANTTGTYTGITSGNSNQVNGVSVNDTSSGDVLWTANKITDYITNSTTNIVQYSGTVTANSTVNLTIPEYTTNKVVPLEILILRDDIYEKAIHGLDYNYAFTSSTNVQITFFNAGTYVANYGYYNIGEVVYATQWG